MTLLLDLPKDLEEALAAEARCSGLSLVEYVLRLLAAEVEHGHQPQNGAQLVAYWQRERLIGERPDIVDSQEHARKLREQAEKR